MAKPRVLSERGSQKQRHRYATRRIRVSLPYSDVWPFLEAYVETPIPSPVVSSCPRAAGNAAHHHSFGGGVFCAHTSKRKNCKIIDSSLRTCHLAIGWPLLCDVSLRGQQGLRGLDQSPRIRMQGFGQAITVVDGNGQSLTGGRAGLLPP